MGGFGLMPDAVELKSVNPADDPRTKTPPSSKGQGRNL
jgi:hypothetical protein